VRFAHGLFDFVMKFGDEVGFIMDEKKTYNYEDLLVWSSTDMTLVSPQKSMDLVERVYLKTKTFPSDELYGLTSQLRRAVTSIPLNIAEGQGRGSSKDFKRFLIVSRGSAYEVNTILQICLRLKYVNDEEYGDFREDIIQITKMISGLIKSLGKI